MFSGERRVSEIIINVKGKRLTRATSAAFVMRSTSSMTMKRRAPAHEARRCLRLNALRIETTQTTCEV
jgi:hypothetical protein